VLLHTEFVHVSSADDSQSLQHDRDSI